MSISVLLIAAMASSPGTPGAPAAFSLGKARTLEGVRIMAAAPAPSGSKFAVILESGELRIIEASTGMTLRKVAWNQPGYGLAWNAKGTQIVIGDESARITIWNAANGQKIKEVIPHKKGVQSIVFSADGTRVMSTGKDDTVKVINLATGKVEQNLLGKSQNFYSAVYIPGGIAVGTLGYSPQIRKGKGIVKLKGHSDDSAFDMDFNQATGRILSAGRDGNAIVWSLAGAKLSVLKGHQDWVQHCRFSPNGRYAATSSIDGTVRVFNVANAKCEATLQDQSTIGAPLCFTADGKYLVSANSSDFCQIRPVNPPQGSGKRRK